MANGKKSVLLYCDIIHTVEELTDEEAGKLFKHYLRYINDQDPDAPDKLTKIIFEPIKQNLKRDLKKWEDKSTKNRANANKRWNANASERIKPDANHADKDTVIVTVKDKVIVKDINKRKAEFSNSLHPFLDKYEAPLLNEFFGYWTEHGEKDKKMRFEKEKSFGLSRRLATWKKREKNFAPKKEKTIMLADKMKQDYGIQ